MTGSAAKALVFALLESPDLETLKKHKVALSSAERSAIPKYSNGDGATVIKAKVDGKTWYAAYTHRACQVRSDFASLLKIYPKVAETA